MIRLFNVVSESSPQIQYVEIIVTNWVVFVTKQLCCDIKSFHHRISDENICFTFEVDQFHD